MNTTADAVIVGGGIVGCACAYYLSQELSKVILIEKGPIGGGATAAGMGHVVVMDDSPDQLALTRYSQSLWHNLIPDLPALCELEKRGTIWVAEDDEEMSFLPDKKATYDNAGAPAEILNAKQLAKHEPNLRKGLAGGLRIAGDSVIYPMTAAMELMKRAKGAELLQGLGASQISGQGVTLEDGEVISAKVVVNAAGGHAAFLTPGLPIEPRKGHLAITDRYPGFLNHQLVELGYLKSAHSMGKESVAFNVQPRSTGQILIGSSRQFVGWDREVDRRIFGMMAARAQKYMPALGALSTIRIWTGFRAATPDKLPLIGQWPSDPGLYIAAGHEGLGITTSLATGRLIADMVSGRASMIDRTPFAPDRETHA